VDKWVRYRRGRAEYSGRITRRPFVDWLATPDGQALLADAETHVRVPLFQRARAARRVWRRLAAAARDCDVVAVVQSEIDGYLARLQEFAYAQGLPRFGVHLHRLVVVPRLLINGATHAAIARRLRSAGAMASLDGGDPVRGFFVDTIVNHLDAAIAGAEPSPKRPIALGTEWIGVGLNSAFVWRIPVMNEPPWNGHHYVLELTRDPVTRAVGKAVAATIERSEAALAALSPGERHDILRRALRGD
jgi:hypothetical protein